MDRIVWTDDKVFLLLHLRMEKYGDLFKAMSSKAQLTTGWNKIQQDFNQETNHFHSIIQLKNKYHLLKSTFKSIKEKEANKNHTSITYPSFWETLVRFFGRNQQQQQQQQYRQFLCQPRNFPQMAPHVIPLTPPPSPPRARPLEKHPTKSIVQAHATPSSSGENRKDLVAFSQAFLQVGESLTKAITIPDKGNEEILKELKDIKEKQQEMTKLLSNLNDAIIKMNTVNSTILETFISSNRSSFINRP